MGVFVNGAARLGGRRRFAVIVVGAFLATVMPGVASTQRVSVAEAATATNGALVYGVIATDGPNGGLRKASPVSGLDAVVVDRLNYEFVGDVSPDGNEIVYANGSNGFNSLRIVGFDGSNDRQIVPAALGLASASWKPDGSKILFGDADWFAWTVNPDGTSKTRVGAITGSFFRFSPDGTKIAYYGFTTGPWGLMVADADGSSPVMIHEYDGHGFGGLDWSPDGGSIVFAALIDNVAQPPWWDCSWNTRQSDLFAIHADGSGLANLTLDDGGPFFAMEAAPAYSPDGTEIAYSYWGWTDCNDGVLETTSTDLYVIDADGTNARLVVDYTTPPDRIGSGAAIRWQACTAATTLCGVDFCGGSLATINGFGNNDLICAGAGNDSIDAGAGNDLAAGGAGDDEVHGGPGNDAVYGGFGNDDLFGDAGNDFIDAGPGFDFAFGGDGSDTLYGKDQADNLIGGAHADVVHGGNGSDTVAGAGGNDTTIGGGGPDTIFGGYGEDVLQGWSGDDTLFGGPADDRLNGDAGADTCEGGAGLNTYLNC